jgi:hypothetical protein
MVVQNTKDVAPDPPGSGPPTLAELNAHYPAQFTWNQLKIFINSGSAKHIVQACACSLTSLVISNS